MHVTAPFSFITAELSPDKLLAKIIDGILNLGDNFLLISLITLSLLLGIKKIFAKYQGQVFFCLAAGILGFSVLKDSELFYAKTAEQIFLISVVALLSAFFVLYIHFLQNENQVELIRFEILILLLLAFFGIILMLSSNEGILIFLGLEIQAFTYYTLVSMIEKEARSAEAALKYFLLGAMASGMFILGVSVLYGITAKTNFVEIAELGYQENSKYALACLLVIVALLFKIGAVPFHLWLPDAYEGAPFYVLLFLISFPKVALFFILYNLNNILETNDLIIFALISTAIVGAIQAMEQTKVKRFIAYTIIFNNCFFLSVILIVGKNAYLGLIESLLLYILITITTVLTLIVLRDSKTEIHLINLGEFITIKKANFMVSLVLMLGFFSSAGIPPLLGFFQKYIILFNMVEQFQFFVSVFLILASMVPAYYYIRVTKNMYFFADTKDYLLQPIAKYTAMLISFGTLLTTSTFY